MNQNSATAQLHLGMQRKLFLLPEKKKREYALAEKNGIWFRHTESHECLPPEKFLDKVTSQGFRELAKWELVPPFLHRRMLVIRNQVAELAKFDELLGEQNVKDEKGNHRRDSGAAS